MQTLESRLKLNQPLSLHVSGILSLVIAAQSVMARVGAVCEVHGVTRPQYNVLRILRGAGDAGHPRHEIAARMVENAPDVTRILDRLVESGLVKRAQSVRDGRESISRITKKGIKLLSTLDSYVSAEENAIGQLLAAKQWRQLTKSCQTLFSETALKH